MKIYNNKNVEELSVHEVQEICDSVKPQYSGIIYVYTNEVNNKCYVGQSQSPLNRHYSHFPAQYKATDRTPFHNAILKYGRDKFSYKVLELFVENALDELQRKLNESEKAYINELNSHIKNKQGYNVAQGGQYNKVNTGNFAPKPVDMYSLKGEYMQTFSSCYEAQKFCGISGGGIRNVCEGTSKTCAGYLWAWKGNQVIIPINENQVHQYDLEGNYIASFESGIEARAVFNGSNISSALKDKHRTAGGFYWRRYKADRIPITDFPKAIFAYNLDGSFYKGYITLQQAIDDVSASGASAICAAINKNNAYRNLLWRREYEEKINPFDNRDIGNVAIEATFPDKSVKIFTSIKATALACNIPIFAVRRLIEGKNTQYSSIVKCRRLGKLNQNLAENGVGVEEFADRVLKKPGRVCRAVCQYRVDGTLIGTFNTIGDALESIGVDKKKSCQVSGAIKQKTLAFGFAWTHKGDGFPKKILERIKALEIHQYDCDGNYVATFRNQQEAAKAIGMTAGNHIGQCLKDPWRKAKGYYWRNYKNEKIDVHELNNSKGT